MSTVPSPITAHPDAPRVESDLYRARIDFAKPIRKWDGFGLNYVEACQSRDYDAEPQDYGGFDILGEDDRRRVIEASFGPDGIRPGVVKMFLDPYHQPVEPPRDRLDDPVIDPAAYDHVRTTGSMRRFVRDGYALLREQGLDMEVIVTLYGPPAWMTRQRFVRGRDLDPACRVALAKYLVAWAKYLRDVEGLPVRFVSLHNEGEDWIRWPNDGSTAGGQNHDYNLFWPPEQVVDLIKLTRRVLDANGLHDVGVSPGETSSWTRFERWGYADAIADDPEALDALGLVTSHGFYGGIYHKQKLITDWCGDWRSTGLDILHARKPSLHSWVTSTSWAGMNAGFVWELMQNIYAAKSHAVIPWACIQRSRLWTGGDPNPGTAFRVHDDGSLTLEPGYYYYRQATRAGRHGMNVCRATINASTGGVIGFARGESNHPNAAVLINGGDRDRSVTVELLNGGRRFLATRTSPQAQDENLGVIELRQGAAVLDMPSDSVTTLIEQP